jgi:hypothetical protein
VTSAHFKEAALAVLRREGFNSETAERLADLIAHEPISAKPKVAPGLERLERALECATGPH